MRKIKTLEQELADSEDQIAGQFFQAMVSCSIVETFPGPTTFAQSNLLSGAHNIFWGHAQHKWESDMAYNHRSVRVDKLNNNLDDL